MCPRVWSTSSPRRPTTSPQCWAPIPRVDLVSFTGSTAVGRLLMRQGADTMKRMFLELGGKSAAIVLDDANPAVIVPTAVGVCVHAGQACAATSRMLVHRSLYDQAVADVTAAYQAVPVGDPVIQARSSAP